MHCTAISQYLYQCQEVTHFVVKFVGTAFIYNQLLVFCYIYMCFHSICICHCLPVCQLQVFLVWLLKIGFSLENRSKLMFVEGNL